MIWLPVHTDLPRNIKLKRLSQLLKIKQAQAVGHLVMLWLWALEVMPQGDLSGFRDDEIAEAAGWKGRDKGKFVESLMEAGFLEQDMRIHDWDDYAGELLMRREKDRLRKQKQRLLDREAKEDLEAEITAKKFALSFGHPT